MRLGYWRSSSKNNHTRNRSGLKFGRSTPRSYSNIGTSTSGGQIQGKESRNNWRKGSKSGGFVSMKEIDIVKKYQDKMDKQ